LRLLSGAGQAQHLTTLSAEHEVRNEQLVHDAALEEAITGQNSAAWDAALVDSDVADLLANTSGRSPRVAQGSTERVDLVSGLTQLNKYLNRAWYRAGIPVQLHDDSTQAVFTDLLQRMGRPRFDALVSDVGHSGIKEVFARETSDGVSFFRSVDMVKKRAQRERVHQALESAQSVAASSGLSGRMALESALHEAIDQKLSPREAALIKDTLMGKTPAEIAEQWGVAPKTVSNEKSRVIQKLREALLDHELN
jgi:RNA polymerase sigma factor (sigma-70 family)